MFDLSYEDGVAMLRLNRPEMRNAVPMRSLSSRSIHACAPSDCTYKLSAINETAASAIIAPKPNNTSRRIFATLRRYRLEANSKAPAPDFL